MPGYALKPTQNEFQDNRTLQRIKDMKHFLITSIHQHFSIKNGALYDTVDYLQDTDFSQDEKQMKNNFPTEVL